MTRCLLVGIGDLGSRGQQLPDHLEKPAPKLFDVARQVRSDLVDESLGATEVIGCQPGLAGAHHYGFAHHLFWLPQ